MPKFDGGGNKRQAFDNAKQEKTSFFWDFLPKSFCGVQKPLFPCVFIAAQQRHPALLVLCFYIHQTLFSYECKQG